MRSLKKSGKYDLQKLKKDALGSLTAVRWIFPLALAFRQQFAVRRGGRTCRRDSGVYYRLGQPEQDPDAPCRGVRDTYLCGEYDRRPRRDALLHYRGYAPALCRNYSV